MNERDDFESSHAIVSVDSVGDDSIVTATLAPPRIWTPFVALACALFAVIVVQALVGAFIAVFLMRGADDIGNLGEELMERLTDPPVFIAMALIPQLIFGGVAIGAAALSQVSIRQRLGLLRPKMSLALYPAMLLGCIVPTAIGLGLAQLVALLIPADPSVQSLYDKMTLPMAIPFVLFIAFAPGLCEELLFRGYCQRRWLDRWSPWSAIMVTSVLFALFHIMPHAVVFAFPIGVWLGYIAWKTDSVWPSIGCHAFVNGLWNILQISFMLNEVSEEVQTWIYAILVGLGLVGFVLTILALHRRSPGLIMQPS